MIEVGIRELKARLSYYVQLVQTGTLVAIKIRERIVGFLSNMKPETIEEKQFKSLRPKKIKKKIEQWKKQGILLSGGLCHPSSIQPIELKGNKTTTELLHQIRNEEE